MKQLNWTKSSTVVVTASSLSVHFNSIEYSPPKYWSITDLKRDNYWFFKFEKFPSSIYLKSVPKIFK